MSTSLLDRGFSLVGYDTFDRYAESTRLKKGTAGVDEAFLREIESWRDLLARTIALRNPALSQREVKKAGGVFYTPKYIVDFIVERTVGQLLEGRTIAQADRLRILEKD